MSEKERNRKPRERTKEAGPERRPFVKPRLERRAKLPKVTNGTAGTFEP